jgi:hypothetical protein
MDRDLFVLPAADERISNFRFRQRLDTIAFRNETSSKVAEAREADFRPIPLRKRRIRTR